MAAYSAALDLRKPRRIEEGFRKATLTLGIFHIRHKGALERDSGLISDRNKK